MIYKIDPLALTVENKCFKCDSSSKTVLFVFEKIVVKSTAKKTTEYSLLCNFMVLKHTDHGPGVFIVVFI